MDKPVIGYLCSSMSWGGLEMNQLRNAFWMHEAGYTVVLFAISKSPIREEAKTLGLPTVTINQHKRYYDLKNARYLKSKLKAADITHLIIRDPKDMSLAALTKTLMKNKLHLSYFMEMQLGGVKKDLIHSIRYKQFDVWSCPLPWLAAQVKQLTNYPENRIHIIPSALDTLKFSALPSKKDARKELELPTELPLFGIIGRFDPQKGQYLLLEALEQLKSEHEFGVVLLGEPTKGENTGYTEKINHFIEKNDLTDKVFIRPFQKETHAFYAAIDCLVMASLKETFGMVTIEAMACGLPIIGSNAGGTPELLEDGKLGKLFEPNDSASLASAIVEQMKQIIPPKSHTDRLKLAAEKFNYKVVNEKVIAVLLN